MERGPEDGIAARGSGRHLMRGTYRDLVWICNHSLVDLGTVGKTMIEIGALWHIIGHDWRDTAAWQP
jgi:hypothetical protein